MPPALRQVIMLSWKRSLSIDDMSLYVPIEMPNTQRQFDWLRALIPWALLGSIAIAAACLYVRTLAPGTVYFQDVAEFQTKLDTLEIIHATGYPFYQALGKLWVTLLPVGSVAWRANLFSAFFAVVCLVCLGALLQQVGVRPWASASACALLACSRLFWTYAILASTYTMHLALVALATLALLRWQNRGGSPVWLALACGVGLAHHRVFAILLPAFALAILLDGRIRRQPLRRWAQLGALAVAPSLASYIWLAALGVWPLSVLFQYLFREGGKYVQHVADPAAWAERLVGTIGPWLAEPFGLAITVLALAGLLAVLRPAADKAKQHTGIALLALGGITLAFFSVAWIAPDDRRYFLQLDLVLAAGWGLAWDTMWEFIRRHLPRRWLAWPIQVILATAALVPLVRLYPASLVSLIRLRDGYADRVSRQILATVESGATIFGTWVMGWPLQYYHTVEQLRPDVRVVVEPGDVYRAEAAALAAAGAPVYFRERMYGLDWETSGYVWATLDVGSLARALPAVPPLAHVAQSGGAFEGGVILRSAGLSVWPLRPDTFVRLSLDWSGAETLAPETGVRLQLDDAAGATRWRYETTWRNLTGDGGPQVDAYWVTPPTLAPGDHTLRVALVEPGSSRSLGEVLIAPIPVADGPALSGERLVIENPLRSPLPIPPQSPDLDLLGYGFLDRELWVGHLAPLSLYWQVVRAPETPYTVSFSVDNGRVRYPLGSCAVNVPYAGALVESLCVLQPPGGAMEGRYQFIASAGNEQGQWDVPLRALRVRDRPHTYRVPRVQQRLEARLGEGIRLLGYDLAPDPARPGQEIAVTLYWRAETAGSAWLKVFVHLVGPDGSLIAQHDSPPANGEAPTSQWLAREVVADRHTISLPVGTPPGEYTVYVGLYSPDTGERLAARDAAGNPYPNNAIPLQTITVEMP
jgi:hypothetical protein